MPDTPYLLTETREIASALNELARHAEQLSVERAAGPLGVVIHDVDVTRRRFRFHPFSANDVPALERAERLVFKGSAHGAQVRFEIVGASLVREVDDPKLATAVLEAELPQQLYRVQRRAFYRCVIPASDRRLATWRSPGGQILQLQVHNLSLGGLGLRSPLDPELLPQPQGVLDNVSVDFGEAGTLHASLHVVERHPIVHHDVVLGRVRHMHLGCQFLQDDRRRERFLQAIIRSVEGRRMPR